MPLCIRYTAPLLGAALLMGAGTVGTDFRLQREIALDSDGRFELEADVGAIDIVGGREQGVSVVITADNAELADFLAFDFQSSAGVARVTARRTDARPGPRTFHGLRFTVRVPSGAQVDARTSSGSVNLERIGADSVVNTAGGSVAVRGVDGDLLATTSGGSISVQGVAGTVRVRTAGGSLTLDALADYVEATTAGGSILASFRPGNEHGGELKTSGGTISVALDPAANLLIDARTSAGVVRSSLPIAALGERRQSRLKGTLGAGGEALKLRTSAGSISLEAIGSGHQGDQNSVML